MQSSEIGRRGQTTIDVGLLRHPLVQSRRSKPNAKRADAPQRRNEGGNMRRPPESVPRRIGAGALQTRGEGGLKRNSASRQLILRGRR